MKIIHTSDIHIDSPLTARLPRDKIKERRTELIGNLRRLTEQAKRQGVTAIIVAGDMFDAERVTRRALTALVDAVEGARDIEFFVLPGNHDRGVFDSEEFKNLRNLHVFTYGKTETFDCEGGVTVTGISPCRAGMFDGLELDADKKNIVVVHGELRDKSDEASESIGLGEAAGKAIDYIALGHYHSYSVHRIDERGVAVYSGTPEGRGFDEAGECGYVLIDTEGKLTHSFVPFARRKIRIIPLDLTGISRTPEIKDRAEVALSAVPSSDLVRLELCGRFIPGLWKDTTALTEAFRDRFYHFEVKDRSAISVNPEDYKNDKTLKGEFIRTVYADESLSEAEKAKIVECGLSALLGDSYH